MLLKLIIVALLAIVIVNMFLALRTMLKGGQHQMSRHLGFRLLFSVLVLLLLLAAVAVGWIQPNPRPY